MMASSYSIHLKTQKERDDDPPNSCAKQKKQLGHHTNTTRRCHFSISHLAARNSLFFKGKIKTGGYSLLPDSLWPSLRCFWKQSRGDFEQDSDSSQSAFLYMFNAEPPNLKFHFPPVPSLITSFLGRSACHFSSRRNHSRF